jgi:hypothetical protein
MADNHHKSKHRAATEQKKYIRTVNANFQYQKKYIENMGLCCFVGHVSGVRFVRLPRSVNDGMAV